ncbi:MAG: hypothetical protein AAGM67_05170 [Bacteroidota bacterium]
MMDLKKVREQVQALGRWSHHPHELYEDPDGDLLDRDAVLDLLGNLIEDYEQKGVSSEKETDSSEKEETLDSYRSIMVQFKEPNVFGHKFAHWYEVSNYKEGDCFLRFLSTRGEIVYPLSEIHRIELRK